MPSRALNNGYALRALHRVRHLRGPLHSPIDSEGHYLQRNNSTTYYTFPQEHYIVVIKCSEHANAWTRAD